MEKMLVTATGGDGEDEEEGVLTHTATATNPQRTSNQERKALLLNVSSCECVTMNAVELEEKKTPLRVGKSARLSAATSPVPGPSSMSSPLSPRRQRAREREKLVKRVVKVVSSPVPYVILVLLFAMIVMIFVDIMPISSLICVAAITMVLVVVLGNHWKNSLIWDEDPTDPLQHHAREMKRRNTRGFSIDSVHPLPDLGPITKEDKIDNLNEFFEDLFNSIDYSLLLIFLGTFIVVENMASTGIPRYIW
jgi:hypothetical protein